MRTPKDSATSELVPKAQVYRIPQQQWEILDELLATYTTEDASKQLNMLLIAGIKDAYYGCDGIQRSEVVTLVYDLIRLVDSAHAIFDNGLNHLDNEFEEAS